MVASEVELFDSIHTSLISLRTGKQEGRGSALWNALLLSVSKFKLWWTDFDGRPVCSYDCSIIDVTP